MAQEQKDINIDFINEDIEVVKKIDAEHYATGYFKELGYKVYFSKKIFLDERKIRRRNPRGTNNSRLSEIYFLYYQHSWLRDCIQDSVGIPDLVMFKDRKVTFVEVKTSEDGLRGCQLKWMKRHNDVHTIVFYLNQIKIKK